MNKVEHALEWAASAERAPVEAERAWPTGLEPDPSRYFGVRWKGRPVRLTLTQLRLVHCLSSQPGIAVEYSKLAKQLDSTTSHRAIATHLSEARQRFTEIDPSFDAIDSAPGKGYVWKVAD
jgi:DNA-binding response OmpR family regulator